MTERRRLRFGAGYRGAPSHQAWVDLVRGVEDAGYSTLVTPDHLITEFGPVAALTAAAAVTSTLRLSTYVLANDFRHPPVLAKELATLDVLSDGRLDVGIGAGWMEAEFAMAGLPFDPPGVRIARLAEAIQILKRLFTGEPVTYEGQYYKVNGLVGLPRPVQQPHPPLHMGGGGRKMLELAAREADIVGLIPRLGPAGPMSLEDYSPAATRQRLEWVRAAAGERWDKIELSFFISQTVVTDDREQVAEQMAQGMGATVEQVLETPYILIGNVDQLAEKIMACREEYGVSYFVIVDEAVQPFAPVVARLAGT
ncbi:MAG TPA: TIGR03621 family F420-dependent LLM class oxidoreductase [Chloroflexia bacterium]|nr:TIGR03621 family F420-dependent LLM class oxidoreductase [Chloroflexia bacterium]